MDRRARCGIAHLLYGAGLRISEALALKRGDAPLGDWLTMLGKRSKERSPAGHSGDARSRC